MTPGGIQTTVNTPAVSGRVGESAYDGARGDNTAVTFRGSAISIVSTTRREDLRAFCELDLPGLRLDRRPRSSDYQVRHDDASIRLSPFERPLGYLRSADCDERLGLAFTSNAGARSRLSKPGFGAA